MKGDWKIHFNRTFSFMEFLRLDFLSIKKSQYTFAKAYNSLITFIESQSHLNTDLCDRLKEVCAIENEKILLSNSKEEIVKIFDFEIDYAGFRDSVQKNPLDNILNLKLNISPHAIIYESNWDWSTSEYNGYVLNFNDILKQPRKNYYFVFQQTGTNDLLTGSNILESPLTEYEYFLLNRFEKPSTIISAIETFIEEFDFTTSEEKRLLTVNTQTLISHLIFKMLLVATPTSI